MEQLTSEEDLYYNVDVQLFLFFLFFPRRRSRDRPCFIEKIKVVGVFISPVGPHCERNVNAEICRGQGSEGLFALRERGME